MASRIAGVLTALSLAAVGLIPLDTRAAGIKVAATIAPVHSLAAMVTEGVVEPGLIVRPGASPHDYAMRPSEASALDEADVVFWVGEGLEPWMAKAMTTLAGDAILLELGQVDGITQLPIRDGGGWAGHDHAHHDDHDHGDHAHGEEDAAIDPHFWLDPANAVLWLGAMADVLAQADAANAAVYRANAETAIAAVEELTSRIGDRLAPIRETPYVVFHDAYHYYESRFDLHPVGSVSLSDADRPGPGRLMAIRETIADQGAVCLFAEPQFSPKLIETISEGMVLKTGVLDPIGADLEPGAGLYPALIEGLADSLMSCLG